MKTDNKSDTSFSNDITNVKNEQPILKDLVAQITLENQYKETDWGAPVGKEVW